MLDLPWLMLVRFGACLAAGCVATAIDLRERRIPNWLTVSLFACGIIFRGLAEQGPGLWDALQGFGVGFGIFLLLFVLGSGAGGDVKFMGAVGVWLGPFHTFIIIVLSALLMLVCLIVAFPFRLVRRQRALRGAYEEQLTTDTEPNERVRSGRESFVYQIVPYALPATLAILLRLLQMLLIGRRS